VKGGAADALSAKPQRDPDGTLAVHLPLGDTTIAGVASDDIGRVALRVSSSRRRRSAPRSPWSAIT
jgi:hypothetical protein